MSQSPPGQPTTAVGQVSPDGQFRWDGMQWVPVPRGTREATPWTRPMQLAAAALLAVEAVYFVVGTFVAVNRNTLMTALQQQNSQVPQGMTEDQFINLVSGIVYTFVIVIAVLELFGALGSFLRWRWAFWYVFVLMCLGSLSFLFGIAGAFRSAGAAFGELLALGAVAMLVWMIVGLVRYGPWAMRRLGPAG